MRNNTTSILNTLTNETAEPEVIILPSYSSLQIPGKPDYYDEGRKNVNSFGTVDLSGFNGTTEELIKKIGADFKAVKAPSYRDTGRTQTLYDFYGSPIVVPVYESVPNNFFCVNDRTNKVIGTNLTERYEIFDFDEGLYFYMGILDEIARRGFEVSPAFAKVYGNGAKMFIQHKIRGGQLMGEPVDTYLSLLTSHDKSSGFMLALSTVRLFCQNQINRMLKSAENKVILRHTTNNQNRIRTEANNMIAMEEKNRAALAQYAESLSGIHVTNQQIFDAYALVAGLEKMKTQRQVNNWQNRMEQFFACYEMPDVNPWRGTALGAYYAMSDMLQHVKSLRTPSTDEGMQNRYFNNIENNLCGNNDLAAFADTLVKVAG